MRLRSPASAVQAHDLGLFIAWSEVAEDARFELARGCPQHAFQYCCLPFTHGRRRPRPARMCGGVAAGERLRTGVNETTFETGRSGHRTWRCRPGARPAVSPGDWLDALELAEFLLIVGHLVQ